MAKTVTTEEWIQRAKSIHGDKYDYTDTVYLNSSTKVSITCPEHGKFEQAPFNHLLSKGCFKCGRKTASSKYMLYSNEEIIEAANSCTERREFQQNYPNLYMAAVNRNIYEQVCAHMKVPYNKVKTTDTFKSEVYSLVENEYSIINDYINRRTKIKVKHNACNNIYEVSPREFLRGRRCPNCVTYGFNFSDPAILYYLKVQVEDTVAYKIGITNLSVKERYSLAELSCITVLHEVKYVKGKDAYEEEQRILKKYAKFRCKKIKLLNSGNTELFSKDILQKDVAQPPKEIYDNVR